MVRYFERMERVLQVHSGFLFCYHYKTIISVNRLLKSQKLLANIILYTMVCFVNDSRL